MNKSAAFSSTHQDDGFFSNPTPAMASQNIPSFEEMMRQAAKQTPASAPPRDDSPGGAESTRLFTAAVLLTALLSALISIGTHWEPNKWLHNDASFYMNTIRSVLEQGTLRQEEIHPHSWYDMDLGWNKNVDAAWSNIALGRHGEWWPKHPILLPLCALPLVWAIGPIGTLVFQVLCILFIALYSWRIASKFAPRPLAMAAVLLFLTTPWMGKVAWGFSNDAFYTALVLAAVDAALSLKAVSAGFLIGMAVFAKPTNVIYAPAVVGVFLLRRDFRQALKVCAAAAIPCLLLAVSNAYLYGAPWKTGYDVTLVKIGKELSVHSHRADFAFTLEGLKSGLKNVFFGKTYGFAKNYPAFFLAVIGVIPMLIRRPRAGILFAWMFAVPIVFHAPFRWYRIDFLLPVAALAAAPLSMLFSFRGQPYAEPFREKSINWARLAPFLAAIAILVSGGISRLLAEEHDVLWDNVKTAKVFHGSRPCDYFNNQLERWECSGIPGDSAMTGRALSGLKFNGENRRMFLAAPTGTSEEKTITFPDVSLGKSLKLQAGLADGAAKSASAAVDVLVDGKTIFSKSVKRGAVQSFSVDTSVWNGKRRNLTFKITGSRRISPKDAPLGLEASVIR